MNSRLCCCLPALLAVVCLGHARAADESEGSDPAAPADSRGLELFESTILPALEEHCYACHSRDAETIEAGLELDSPAGLRLGGDSGPMLTAHDADHSRLLLMLRHHPDESAMPPDEPLPDELVAAFEEWIRLGAPDSREDSGPTAKEERLEASRQHWAFVGPQAAEPPSVQQADWPRDSVIDPFVLAQLEAAGIQPTRDSSRTALIRRLYFDLLGLPPTPKDIDEFLADESPQAVESLVDRLLASPQFGERWGRHWLDVVRFAESSGMEFNFTYPHAWPFRDYVIDSFNQDKPYDEFLREQIAGDLLPAVDGESAADAEARRIAVGVLAFGPKRHNSSGTQFQMDMADDQIDMVFKATQAMTVSCARCHDHKFDPIPTQDYYALAGIFLSTEPLFGTIKQKYSNTPTDLLPIGEDAQARHDAAEAHQQAIAQSEEELKKKEEELKAAAEAEEKAKQQKSDADQLLAAVTDRQQATATAETTESSAADQAAADKATAAEAVLTEAVELSASLKSEVESLKGQLEELKKNQPERPRYAMTARDRAEPADTKLAIRGDFRSRGDVVPRGFLSAVNVPDTSAVNPDCSGRLELAHWIASPQNPLTARVMVNRIWHHLFGRGLVSTVDNFGTIGKSPTHPELLDALALRFVDSGWSVKTIVREIVLSRTWQLSTQPTEAGLAADPDNRLLWRATPRRLEAEAIRDAVLTVSGQLDLTRPTGSTVTGLGDKLVRGIATEKLQPPSVHRSVYLPVVRDYLPELFDLFDFPSPSLVSGRRAITNVPSQALYLRNSKFIAEQASHAASRLLATDAASDDDRIDLSMRQALGRYPSEAERTAIRQLIADVRQQAQQAAADAAEDAAEDAENDSAAESQPTADATAWSAWYLALFSTAEFRCLVDVTPHSGEPTP